MRVRDLVQQLQDLQRRGYGDTHVKVVGGDEDGLPVPLERINADPYGVVLEGT